MPIVSRSVYMDLTWFRWAEIFIDSTTSAWICLEKQTHEKKSRWEFLISAQKRDFKMLIPSELFDLSSLNLLKLDSLSPFFSKVSFSKLRYRFEWNLVSITTGSVIQLLIVKKKLISPL